VDDVLRLDAWEGRKMDMSTIRMTPTLLLSRLFSAFVVDPRAEIVIDPNCLTGWLAESRQLRLQASRWAETPPLPSD
jgi:hypothetical protein